MIPKAPIKKRELVRNIPKPKVKEEKETNRRTKALVAGSKSFTSLWDD